MPEGDTLFKAAAKLAPALVGARVEAVAGSAPAMQRDGRVLVGREIEDVFAVGKHLVIDFERNASLRTHLGMHGQWRLYERGTAWGRDPGPARVVLKTADHEAVCFAAPRVQVGSRQAVRARIDHLGPDLLDPDFDEAEAMRRARATDLPTISDLLLDQSVMAGVGNVFKNEVLFMEKVHPEADPADLDDEVLRRIIRQSRKQLLANRTTRDRVTTGGARGNLWVYKATRRPCRRCGEPIVEGWVGAFPRITYWCDACQERKPGA